MKKQIAIKLSVFVICVWALLLCFNSIFQYNETERTEIASSLSTIEQIEEVLVNNDLNLDTLTESLQDEYIIKAQTAAYILEIQDFSTEAEYQELANLLGVDEIHVFNDEGVIYEGSVAIYYGYNFDSGEQMSFFKPLLYDKSLTLCQDITPNTAESKYMMYIATWNSAGSDIIQIGIEPERILEEQQQNEISYIFANMLTASDTDIFAIDSTTGVISGCSSIEFVDMHCSDIGLTLSEINIDGEGFEVELDGIKSLCVFKEYDDIYIGVTTNISSLQQDVFQDMINISFYFTLIAIFLFFVLFKIIEITILNNFEALTVQVSKIAGGDLDTVVDIQSSPEFTKLSHNLNIMVSSLLNSTNKMSHVLDRIDSNIAVYEYKKDMQRVFSTRKLYKLLDVYPDELEMLLSNKQLFEIKIQEIKKQTTSRENIYRLENDTYLKIETIANEDGKYGIILDVTDDIKERARLKHERDYDLLTDVYNRRALYRKSESIYGDANILKEAVLIALDGDNLKEINDTYGHDAGDLAIKHSAHILRDFPVEKKIVGRLGGDEFIVIFYGEDMKKVLLEYIHTLRTAFDQATITIENKIIPLHMSAGYIFSADHDLDYTGYLKCADTALYAAKNTGKNKFVEYNDKM